MQASQASKLALATLVLAGACARQSAPGNATAAAERDISAMWSGYRAAGEASDVAGFLAITTEDVALSSPGTPTVRGQAGLRTFMVDAFKAVHYSKVSLTLGEAIIVGDRASQFGTYRETYSALSGGPATTNFGQFGALLRRGADGKWRIAQQIAAQDSSITVRPR